jgi:hypothetical protein
VTLRRAEKTVRYRGTECAIYELWFTWGEEAFADDREFFRPIIETAPFQRALDLLPRPILQVYRGEDSAYRLRVITPPPDEPDSVLPDSLEV